jgi:hypothetical protein
VKAQQFSLALRLRFAWIGWALLAFLWIQVEDQSPQGAVILAGLCMAVAAVQAGHRAAAAALRQRLGPVKSSFLVGVAAGLAVAPFALLLMTTKSGLHAHTAPEYTSDQMVWVLLRMPIWTAVGGLTGLAIGLISLARREK